MITIVEANTKKLLLDFIKFPFSLYKKHPYWVPPLINDELETFDKSKNPAFENADAIFYLAYQNNKIVGRVCAIINWDEVKKQHKSKIRFGWFDFIDDIEVSRALLHKVSEIGKQNNLQYMEGPMGFSNLDKVGVLTEGFNEIGSMITWYNYPYYAQHLEKLGFTKEKEYLENKFPFANVKSEHFEKANNLVRKRYELQSLTFKKTKDIMPYVDEMFELFNASYANLSSFVAITNSQKEYFKKKYISFINPEYIIFVQDKNSKLVGFSIVMPSFAAALQKANGKLFPFGFYHLIQAKKNSKEVLFYLIGIAPEYQNKGVHAVIFDEYFKTFTNKKILNCIRTPELSDNHAIHNIWKHFNPETFKKRCTYRIDL
ncbi:MAG: GTP cyclohydrolase [Flavobacterium sp.]|nr:GTP cyclohydrolase [Flavobacterium sp.]